MPAGGHDTGAPPGPPAEYISSPPSWVVSQLHAALPGVPLDRIRQVLMANYNGYWNEAAVAAYTSLSGGVSTTPPPGEDGGSSGGSSGGSAASTGPKTAAQVLGEAQAEAAIRNAVATYRNMLTAWGVPVDNSVMQFIQRSVRAGMNSAAFLAAFRKTKMYAQTFPGIMRHDGTMRMSEAQYLAGYQQAKDYAASVGRNLTPQAYGQAIKNGNSPTEIKQKIEALDILKSNKLVFAEFSDYLMQTGVTNKPLDRKDLLKFVMKQGPKQWEDAWTLANESAMLSKFNFDVGPGGDIGWKGLKELEAQLLPGEKPDYQALAQAAQTLSASRLYKLGITKRDLLKLVYNAKGADQIASRVKLALGTQEATATEQRANPQLTRQGQYQGTPQVQATE